MPSFHQENKIEVLLTFWEKLMGVTQLTFQAKTKLKEEKGWNGKGQGKVGMIKEGFNTLICNESGTWQNKQGEEIHFTNIFRWTLDRNDSVISLEHLRRGPDHPVFLFYLAPCDKYSLSAVDSHLCKDDSYFGQIHFDREGFHLNWRIIGPKKNEEIDYYYS